VRAPWRGQSSESFERQKGDPDLPYETVTYDGQMIRDLAERSGKASFERWDSQLPSAMLIKARGFIGASRLHTPERIAPLLEVFGLALKDGDGRYVPFCAAGLSYCGLSAYADSVRGGYSAADRVKVLRQLAADVEHYYFYPTVSCNDMALIARAKRRWRAPDDLPKPGWIVLFDWEKSGRPDHCGVVERATQQSFFTVEFNTATGSGSQRNGGVVAERNRTSYREFVAGYIATDLSPTVI
jgi:hypothetical protein